MVPELTSCKPREPVLVYPEIGDGDARPDRDRQHSPRRSACGDNFGYVAWHPQTNNVPAITWRSRLSARRTSSLSVQCPSLHLRQHLWSTSRKRVMRLIMVGVEQLRCLEVLFGQTSLVKRPTDCPSSFVPRNASCVLRVAVTCSVRHVSISCGGHRASASLVLLVSQQQQHTPRPLLLSTSSMSHVSPVQAMYAARRSVVENIPSVGVLHRLLIYVGYVNAILRWARLVVFLRRCHVQSRMWREHHQLHSCEMTLPWFFDNSTVCWTVASFCCSCFAQSFQLCATPSSSGTLLESRVGIAR